MNFHREFQCLSINVQIAERLGEITQLTQPFASLTLRYPDTPILQPTPLSAAHAFASGRSSVAIMRASSSSVTHWLLLSLP